MLLSHPSPLVRVAGIEPASRVWKTRVLPLNDTRMTGAGPDLPGPTLLRVGFLFSAPLSIVPTTLSRTTSAIPPYRAQVHRERRILQVANKPSVLTGPIFLASPLDKQKTPSPGFPGAGSTLFLLGLLHSASSPLPFAGVLARLSLRRIPPCVCSPSLAKGQYDHSATGNTDGVGWPLIRDLTPLNNIESSILSGCTTVHLGSCR